MRKFIAAIVFGICALGIVAAQARPADERITATGPGASYTRLTVDGGTIGARGTDGQQIAHLEATVEGETMTGTWRNHIDDLWAFTGTKQAPTLWRDPSPHTVQLVTVDDNVRLQVLDWGGSGPPLVLLGCYMSVHMYDEFAPKLTTQFHVYGVTRRGIGASDKPAAGYTVQRSADDLLAVLDALKLQKAVLVGHSCAGQILTLFARQHSDRLHGLIYLDGASDPTMTPADVGAQMPDPAMLPRPIKPSPPSDNTSFAALRASQRSTRGWAFPEAQLRQQYVANADGSVGRSQLDPVIRRAITTDARVKPDYSGIRVPVLAIYQKQPPFEEVAANYLIRNEQERGALRQEYEVTRALYVRWQQDLLAAIPTARIVELPGANLYMFLSNEADVLRKIRGFAATLWNRAGR
jgi:non-heme chloroperoxidase